MRCVILLVEDSYECAYALIRAYECYPWLASILDKSLLADDNIRQEQNLFLHCPQ